MKTNYSPRNTTQTAAVNGNALDAGYRARQGALMAEDNHVRREVSQGPSTLIPICQGIVTIIAAILLWSFLYQKGDSQNPYKSTRPTYHDQGAIEQRAKDLDSVRSGTYQGNGIVPVPEYVIREQRRLGLRD